MGLALRHIAKGQPCPNLAPAAGHLQQPATPASGNPMPVVYMYIHRYVCILIK